MSIFFHPLAHILIELQTNVYNLSTHTFGTARHFIVTVEQLFKTSDGRSRRLNFLIRNCLPFQRKIIRINVDEAHFIHTAGLPLYGLPPFYPAWGRLDEIKVSLPNHVRWKAFSATFPPHILKTIAEKVLKINYIPIHVTSNRPNTMYATHQVHGSIEDARNYECFIKNPFELKEQPHVLIFFDNDMFLTNKVAQDLNACLPAQFRGRGIVRHYHSGMSKGYLQQAYDSFVKEDGECRILVISGQSVVSIFESRINLQLI